MQGVPPVNDLAAQIPPYDRLASGVNVTAGHPPQVFAGLDEHMNGGADNQGGLSDGMFFNNNPAGMPDLIGTGGDFDWNIPFEARSGADIDFGALFEGDGA